MCQAPRWKSRQPATPICAVMWGLWSTTVCLVPAAALADDTPPAAVVDDATVAQTTALNRQAIDLYERGDFEEARAVLQRALILCSAAGLEKHPIYARTVLHIGVVLVGGLNQRAAGVAQFRKALQLSPEITISRSLASPELTSAFEEAVRAPSAEAATDATAEVGSSAALVHTPVTEGKRGSAISISVVVQNGPAFDRLMLAYRSASASDFLGRPLRPAGSGSFSAEIPSSATQGDSVAYFIEALDKDGDVVAARGSVTSPLFITLVGRPRRVRAIGRDDGDGNDSDGNDGDGGPRRFLAAFTVGTGVGVASGNGDLNADVMTSGAQLSMARVMHLSPEVGIWFSRSLLLSLQARLQLVGGTTDLIRPNPDTNPPTNRRYRAAGRTGAVFARATWFFRPAARVHPLFSLSLGAGQIRHVVTLSPKDCGDDQMQVCRDTITAGPILAGAGTGFLLPFTRRWSLMVQVNAQLAATHSTLNIDVNLGGALQF